jgi:dephospho-CoA kinase
MKQNKKIIVLTGGIASGKSTVGKILKDRGYEVVESDKIVHKLYSKNSEVYNLIIKEFGSEVAGEDSINRKKLGNIVFNDDKKIKKLNKIVHKYVVKELIKRCNENEDDIIFLDIPLMIEEKYKLEKYGLEYDEIWLIKSHTNTRVSRIMKRDGISWSEAERVISNQMTDEKKEKYADIIIENNGNLHDLKERIVSFLTNI